MSAVCRRTITPFLVVGIMALALMGCGKDPSKSTARITSGLAKNLLLITMDTTRADRLGCYGYEAASTPHLDSLASRGVTFERCISVAPITLPSHASILTGLYPYNHGVRNNGTHYLEDDVTTLAEILDTCGFQTGAVVSAFVLDSRYRLDQGFSHYDDDLSDAEETPMFKIRETRASNTAERSIGWLEGRGPGRFFLWVHFFDPHADYRPEEPYRTRFKDSPYDGEIAFMDEAIGQIIAALKKEGALENTLVVSTADHGESLGEHGEKTHSMFIYDATTRVPLIISHPQVKQGHRVAPTMSSVDIVPTALDLLGVDVEETFDGRSFASALQGDDPRLHGSDSLAYSESMTPWYNFSWSDLRALRDDGHRYVRAPRPELYDLDEDPAETRNIVSAEPRLQALYHDALEAMLPKIEEDSKASSTDALDRDALAALGYLQDPGASTSEGSTIDPKDKIEFFDRIHSAHAMVRRGLYEEAEPILRSILEEDPGSLLTRNAMATTLIELDRKQEAVTVLRESLPYPGIDASMVLRLSRLEMDLGLEEGHARLAMAKSMDGRDPLPWVYEGQWWLEDSELEAARGAFEKALKLDARCAKAWLGMADVWQRIGNVAEAEKALRRAIDADRTEADAWYNLGVLLDANSRTSEAVEAYERCLDLDPDKVDCLVNLGSLHWRTENRSKARDRFEQALDRDPENPGALVGMGFIRLGAQDLEAARKAFEVACAKDPSRADGWRGRMMCAAMSADYELALEAAKRLLALESRDSEALMTAALASKALKRDELARQYVREALESDEGKLRRSAAKNPALRAILQEVEGR